MLALQGQLLGGLRVTVGRVVDFTERRASAAPQEVDRGVGRNPRQPVRRLLLVLELFLVLQRLDERFLGEVLSVRDVAHDAVDLQENPA